MSVATVQLKAFAPVLLKASAQGLARVVVATMHAEDSDGDVTLPGAFGTQTVAVQPAHDHRHYPLGKARLYEDGGRAIADVQFNMDTEAGRHWHSAIKFDLDNSPSVIEYSYAYTVLPGGSRVGEFKGRRVRFLQPLPSGEPGVKVHEVSPLLQGAGVGTGTLEAKLDDEVAREYMRYVALQHGIDLGAARDEAAREYLRHVARLRGGNQ